MQGLLKWLAERRDPDMPSEGEYQLRLESDDDAVRIMTVHKSKGLEFPVVFCPFAWSPVKTNSRNAPLFHNEEGSAIMDFGSADLPQNTARAEQEALAENVRLLYVALTRAKNRCYMAWGRVKDAESSAVNYLIRSRAIAGDENPVESLKLAGLDEGSMRRGLESHIEAAKAHAVIRDIPMDAPQPLAIEALPAGGIAALDFSTDIDRSWGIASYTMFIHGLHERREPADRDMLAPAVQADKEEGTQAGREAKKDIFSFPKGARAGTLLHEVFERIDFTGSEGDIRAAVQEILNAHGLDRTWTETVACMVKRVLRVDLGGVRLEQVAARERLTELEFMFPLKPLTAGILESALEDRMSSLHVPSPLAGEGVGEGAGPLPSYKSPRLAFDPVKGFLRGFMDLVFRHQGKYYLIDWKSNHLGDAVEDYGQDALLQSMIRDGYILQYHLYMVALHQYLKHRLEGYSYHEHCGGVFYVFLRGVDPEKGPEYGIFHARPNEENLMKLSEVLID
jgi:exodeoxyribonuclease V beta subunit